ncbi:MAG TPA: hypothetical protein VGM76_17845 [Lacipirellulaceae bacterium]|jgi:hypothetical protein
MWCSNCQQDVAAIGQPGTNKCVCTRCQRVLRPPHAVQICEAGIALDEHPTWIAAAVVPAATSPPFEIDDWDLRRRNRELGRKLRHDLGRPRPRSATTTSSASNLAPPENLFDELQQVTAPSLFTPTEADLSRRPRPSRRPEGGQFMAWVTAFCGAGILGAGLGKLSWSLSSGRNDDWNIAVGLTLMGQGLLIFGLVLIAARLWRNSRYASSKLIDVHTQLGQLQHTTDALTAMRSGAPAFYAELVRGASPQMLLANLKGQLDQLATRIGGDL